MHRRDFLSASAAAAASAMISRATFAAAQPSAAAHKTMPLGLLISPADGPEEAIRRVHDLGFPTCFLSLDAYIGKFTPQLAEQFRQLLAKYQVTATTVEVVGPQPLKWNFLEGPTTIGLVPRPTRAARIDALRQASDFAKLLGIPQV